MEHHLSLHTRFSTILYMLLPSMGANKVLGEVHGQKHNQAYTVIGQPGSKQLEIACLDTGDSIFLWRIHCHWKD